MLPVSTPREHRVAPDAISQRQQDTGPQRLADEAELRAWVEHATGGAIAGWDQISGGNRCRSWAIRFASPAARPLYLRYQPPRPPSVEPYTVWREARIYEALKATDIAAPRLVAVHPEHPAILTELKPGRAEYRLLSDDGERKAIARDFAQALARLHGTHFPASAVPGLDATTSMADCVRAELVTWSAMYVETGEADPLIELAMDWLAENVPEPSMRPVLVHGDAGTGNFLFDQGRMTALIDWELAHPGDPMEDLAWFSMRNVMEPVPDFAATIRDYVAAGGAALDLARIRYHRVFVSARVVIIRHRNVTGQPGASIISRALNRRLLVDALAEATGVALPASRPIEAGATSRTGLYDGVIDGLRDEIGSRAADAQIVAAAKNSAKVLKYLREADRLGGPAAHRELAGLSALLGRPLASVEEGRSLLLADLRADAIRFDAALRFFAERVADEAQMAALASGGLAHRKLPSLDGLEGTT